MTIPAELRENHAAALAAARTVLSRVGTGDLTHPTPCRGWDLRMLNEHLIGQNEGFAAAIAGGDAPGEAYAPRRVGNTDTLLQGWDESVEHLLAAVAACAPDRPVRLVEITTYATFAADTAVRMHLLDTVVHTWDVATALGQRHRPDQVLLDLVAAVQVPGGDARTRPGAAFAPSLETSTTTYPWALTLARLGRNPTVCRPHPVPHEDRLRDARP
jgi:uncharacterized protein (TIGR03086 family)